MKVGHYDHSNISNYLPSDTASHPSGLSFSERDLVYAKTSNKAIPIFTQHIILQYKATVIML